MSIQLESDRRLMQFREYEDYLDAMVTCQDLMNLQSTLDSRMLAELGYRSSGDTLTREKFYKRLEAVTTYFYPKVLPTDLVSPKAEVSGTLLRQLAVREEGNRTGKLATIIFIRLYTRQGHEISGYIDYAERLRTENWLAVFQGKKGICPRKGDLSFYHWRNNTITKNNSLNYKVVIDPSQGLLFQCWHDRKLVNVNPGVVMSWHTARVPIPTKRYEHVVLYDHIVRRRN